MYSKQELEEQESEITKSLSLIMLPIVGIIIIISVFFSDRTSEELKEICDKNYELSYSGFITSLKKNQWKERSRTIIINNSKELFVYWDIYEKLEVGDFIEKEKSSDFVCYYTKKHGLIEDDINDFYREKYLESLQQNDRNKTK